VISPLFAGTRHPWSGYDSPRAFGEYSIKRILLQLGDNWLVGVFDSIMAYDAGVDCVLQLGMVRPQDVPDLVHETVFARNAADLKNLAMFIGGSDVAAGEALLTAIQAAFFGPMRVSVMLDSNGSNTTAAAVVAKILSVGTVAGQRTVVLAGTGPVGLRTAALLAREGALVTLTSRQLSRARVACASIRERFAVSVSPAEVADATQSRHALQAAEIVVAAGAAGVTLLPQTNWNGHPTLRILADVNAVPPSGIEGIEPTWDGCSLAQGGGQGGQGGIAFGALAIGALKKRTHYACLTRLFERTDGVLDAEEICAVAKELQCASSSLA
jgi:hypothetical protein